MRCWQTARTSWRSNEEKCDRACTSRTLTSADIEATAEKVTDRRKTGAATLNIYSVEEAVAFKECSLLRFDSPDEAWLDFVAENRQGTYQGKQHDLIYGAVANDDVYRTITLYMTGVLDKEQTLAALKIRKLFNQLVFATEKSLQYLHFEGRELV